MKRKGTHDWWKYEDPPKKLDSEPNESPAPVSAQFYQVQPEDDLVVVNTTNGPFTVNLPHTIPSELGREVIVNGAGPSDVVVTCGGVRIDKFIGDRDKRYPRYQSTGKDWVKVDG